MESATEPILKEINQDNAEDNPVKSAEYPDITMPGSPIATSSEKGEISNTEVNGLAQNEEFSDAKDCLVIMPAAEQHQTPLRKPVETSRISTLPLIPEVSHNASSSSDSSYSSRESGFCSCCSASCCYDYNRCIRATFNSPFTLPFYLVSMALPITAGYMGAKYMQDCPAGASTPLFLFLIGLCGVLCVASRMVDVVQHWVFPHSQVWDFPSYTCFFSLMTILLLLITEMMVMLRIEPNFNDMESEDYCHPVFYNFTYYGNFVGFILVMSSCIVYLPRILCSPQTHIYPHPYQGV